MRTAAVSKLKASLSEYLRGVKAGEELLVTDRGSPIARIVPIRNETGVHDEDLYSLERDGLLRRGVGQVPKEFWDEPVTASPSAQVVDALIEERRSGR
jgi:prevent-host-death family protein